MPAAANTRRNLMELAGEAPAPIAPEAGAAVPVREMPGLATIAKLDAAAAMLAAKRKLATLPFSERVLEILVEAGAGGLKPENFTAVDGAASGSCQFRRSGANTPLTDEKEAAIAALGLPTERKFLSVATYRVNPKYALDPSIIRKAGEALGAAGLPDDLIERVPEVSFAIVGEEAVEQAYANYAHDPDTLRRALKLIGDVVVIPEWNGEAKEVAEFAQAEFLADAELPAQERAIVKAKALEKSRRASKKAA